MYARTNPTPPLTPDAIVRPCVTSGEVTDENAGSTEVGTTAKPSISGAPTISRLAPTRRLFLR